MVNESTESDSGTRPQNGDSNVAARSRLTRRGRWLSLFVLISAVAGTVVFVACGNRQSSPTAPSDSLGTWPVVAPPAFGGLSIAYPPDLQPTIVNKIRVAFGGGSVSPDTDMPAAIEFSSYAQPTSERLQYIRSTFDAIHTDSAETIGSSQVHRLVGLLDFDVFGWGGTVHGYFVFPHGARTVVVGYDAENRRMADYALEMVRRTLQQ